MKQFLVCGTLFCVFACHAQERTYRFSHTDSTTAAAARIWQLWTDVDNWKQWDKGLQSSTLNGAFVTGAKGSLLPDKGPRSQFVLTEVIPGRSYSFETRIPFGRLVISRTLAEKENKTFFTHTVTLTGLLRKVLGKRYKAMLPTVLATIQQLAEEQ